MNKLFTIALAAGLISFIAPPVQGQEAVTGNTIIVGARALGMGGAQIGAVNDVTAVIHNPAALTRIDQFQAQLGLTRIGRTEEAKVAGPIATGSGSFSDVMLHFGTIGVAYPYPTTRGSLVFAVGVNKVNDFSGTYSLSGYDSQAFEQDGQIWGGNFTDETVEEGGLNVLSLAGAVDVAEHVSFGASLDIWRGTYGIDSRVLRNNTTDKVSWLDLYGGNDDITAFSLKPSMLYFADRFRVGAYVRLPMTFHIDQNNYKELYSANDGYYFGIHERIDPSIKDQYTDSSDYWRASYQIKAPAEAGLGFSLGRPGIRCLALDLVYQNWNDAKIEDDLNPDPYYFQDKYRNTLNWAVGLEHALPRLNSVIRAGYRSEPLNFKGPRDMTGPIIEATRDRRFVTLGFSTNLDETIQFDLGYAHGTWTQREGNRKDSETSNRVYASFTYHISRSWEVWQAGDRTVRLKLVNTRSKIRML